MKQERRFFANDLIEVRALEDSGKKLRGHAAVFNKLSEDLGGFREQIAIGAFDGVLDDDVRALYNHNPDYVLGRNKAGTLRLAVDDTGLSYEVDMPDTQIARDLAVSIERGDVNQSSFGFIVAEDAWENVGDEVVRTIVKFHSLFDVSPVTYPAYPDAKVGMRSLEKWREEQNLTIETVDYSHELRRLALLQAENS